MDQIIEGMLLITPDTLRYSNLKEFLESNISSNPKELTKVLDLYYLTKKFDALDNLLIISLFYKTYISLNTLSKSSYYTFEHEKYSLNIKLKDRLKYFHESKKLNKICFCNVLSPKHGIPSKERVEIARTNIKIVYADIFQLLFKNEDVHGLGFGFMGRIFLKWALILESGFETEDILQAIELIKISVNPRIYQTSSYFWGLDYAKLWVLFKIILKTSSRSIEKKEINEENEFFQSEMNLQVFFEVFPEDEIKKYVKECWDDLKKFIEIKEKTAILGFKRIFQICFTKKTLKFFIEMTKIIKKERDVKKLALFFQDIVLESMLDKLKGNFFTEIFEILRIYLMSN